MGEELFSFVLEGVDRHGGKKLEDMDSGCFEVEPFVVGSEWKGMRMVDAVGTWFEVKSGGSKIGLIDNFKSRTTPLKSVMKIAKDS